MNLNFACSENSCSVGHHFVRCSPDVRAQNARCINNVLISTVEQHFLLVCVFVDCHNLVCQDIDSTIKNIGETGLVECLTRPTARITEYINILKEFMKYR